MAEDRYSSYPVAPGHPAVAVLDIEPSDTTDLPEVVMGLNVETPGTVRVTTRGGTTGSVFVAAGTVFPLRVVRVWATGTTATGIRGLA